MSKTIKTEKDYDDYDEVMRYLIDELDTVVDNNKNITLLVDYEIATDLSKIYEEDEFENYYGISLASDCAEYLVTKHGDDAFIIEPAKHCGIYYDGEHDKLIVLEDLMSDEFIDRQEYNELEIVCFDEECEDDEYEDEEGCHCDECCNCCGCNDDIDDEDAPYIDLSEMIDEYTELIKDNECDEEAISFALMEYGVKLLQKFSVEKIEED